MTDTSKREELIEAFKSKANEWDSYDFDPNWDYSTEAAILADIALAVFEQAYTPTFAEVLESLPTPDGCPGIGLPTDEREALIKSYAGWDFVEVALNPNGASRVITDLMNRLDAALRRTAVQEPHAEPPCEHEWQNRVSGGSKCTKCHLWQDKRVPQGEPSDAEVGRAVVAYRNERNNYGHMDSDVHARCIRAALRAAAAIRQEEKR